MTRIDEIRARLKAATPGPYETGVMYTGMYKDGPAYNDAIAYGRLPTSSYMDGRERVFVFRSQWPEETSIVVKDTGSTIALSTNEYHKISKSDAQFLANSWADIDYLLDLVARYERDIGAPREDNEQSREIKARLRLITDDTNGTDRT